MEDDYGYSFDDNNDFWEQGILPMHDNWVDTVDQGSDVWEDDELDYM